MKLTTKFCVTCNARERIIEHGKCIICGNPPEMRVDATDPPMFTREMIDQATDKRSDWSFIDKYVLVLCVVATWYMLWQVARFIW